MGILLYGLESRKKEMNFKYKAGSIKEGIKLLREINKILKEKSIYEVDLDVKLKYFDNMEDTQKMKEIDAMSLWYIAQNKSDLE